MSIIDLSHKIEDEMPVYPGTPEVSVQQVSEIKQQGYAEKRISFSSHTGTHIDAPAHMIQSGKHLDCFPISKFIGYACLIPFSQTDIAGQSKYKYLKRFENLIKESEFVILNTKWSQYWNSSTYFNNFPALDKTTAEYLASFPLKGVGIDTASVDKSDSEFFDAHHSLLKNEILIVENLCRLNKIPWEKFIFSALPLYIGQADGAPVRAIAYQTLNDSTKLND